METTNKIESSTQKDIEERKTYVRANIIFTIVFAVICAIIAGIFALIFLVLAPNADKGANGLFLGLLSILGVILFLVLVAMLKTTFQDDAPKSGPKLKYIFASSQILLIILAVAACVFSVIYIFNTIGTTYERGDFSDNVCDGCFIFTNNRADGGRAVHRMSIDKDDVEIYYYCKDCFVKIQEIEAEMDNNKNNVDESDAWSAAKDVVRSKLKAPSTASFCSKSSAAITKSGNTWTIKGYVDAENSFGAMIRNDFTVVITFKNNNDYTIDSCTITAR